MIPRAPRDSQRAESRKGFRSFRIVLRCVRSHAPAPTARSRASRRHPGIPRQTLRRTCPHGVLPDSVCRHVASFRLGGGYRGVAMPGSRVLSLVRFTCDRSGIITRTTSLPKERKKNGAEPSCGSTPFFAFCRRVGFRPSCRGRCLYSYSNETASESEFVATAFVTEYEEPSSAVTKNSRWQLSFFHDESSVMTNM